MDSRGRHRHDRDRYGGREVDGSGRSYSDRHLDRPSDRGSFRGRDVRERSREREGGGWDRDRGRGWDKPKGYHRDFNDGPRDNWRRDGRGHGRFDDEDQRNAFGKIPKPNNTIMMRGLQPDCNEHMLLTAVNEKTKYNVHNLRLVRDKLSGYCKGFAFLEFYSIDDAIAFMKEFAGSTQYPDQYGDPKEIPRELFISDRPVSLEYSTNQTDVPASHRQSNDWVCPVCHKINFSRRTVCFSCSHPFGPDCQLNRGNDASRGEYRNLSSSTDVTILGCKVLHVSNLPLHCSEEIVHRTFSEFGSVQAVRLTPTGGRAFVEYVSTKQAEEAFRICLSQQNILRIGDSIVHVEMANMIGGQQFNYVDNNMVATAAMQAASWSSQHMQQRMIQSNPMINPPVSMATQLFTPTQLNPGILQEFPTPFDQGGMTYRVEPKSGLYFEDKSGFYYDFNQKIYYSTQKKKYYKYVDGKFEECKQPTSSANKEAVDTRSTKPTGKDPGLLSFEIQAEGLSPEFDANSDSKEGSKLQERKVEKVTPLPKEAQKIVSNLKNWKNKANIKPICSLCRRKFKSHDKLEKHVKLSEMHKANLEKQKILTASSKKKVKPISTAEPHTVEAATKAAAAAGYRDRAGDRRKLFGQTGKPGSKQGTTSAEDREKLDKPLYESEENNAGTKLLKAMGWKEGQGLGKEGKGITAPIRVDGTIEKTG